MIGIIGATDFEMIRVLAEMDVVKTEVHAGYNFQIGSLYGQEIVAVKAGIGKVFASGATVAMILNYKIDSILNIGAAGGLITGLQLGDAVLVKKTVQYDMDTTAFGDPLGLISGINKVKFDLFIKDGFKDALNANNIKCIEGENATGDIFCTDLDAKKMLVEHFNCTTVEMEACAIAQICYINEIKLESIKIISDEANDNSSDDYTKYTGTVGDRVMEILKIRFSM